MHVSSLYVCVFIRMHTQKYRAMAIYIYIGLKLTFPSQLFPKYVVVIVCLKVRDAKNRNWSISLQEEPVKGRVSNHGTPLIRWFDEQLLHNVSVTTFKKKTNTNKQNPNQTRRLVHLIMWDIHFLGKCLVDS